MGGDEGPTVDAPSNPPTPDLPEPPRDLTPIEAGPPPAPEYAPRVDFGAPPRVYMEICRSNDECGPQSHCADNGRCYQNIDGPCAVNDDCNPNHVCGTDGLCTEAHRGQPCGNDADCPIGSACDAGACGFATTSTECSADSECGPGEWCRVDTNGQPAICYAAQDCQPDFQECQVYACSDSRRCGQWTFCYEGQCRGAPFGGGNPCIDRSDCAAGNTCVDGICSR